MRSSTKIPPIKPWPADKVERRPISDLIPYARNARTHSDKQVAQIAASIKEFGFTNPVLVDHDGGIIAGHGRVLAARQLGLTDLPVMIANDWTEAQKKAYVLADNQLAVNAGWDMELLKVELDDLAGLDFDIGLIGFDDKMLAAISATGDSTWLCDPDEVGEPPAEPIATTGDLWALGRHRLLCGDCTVVGDVDRVMNGSRANLCLTDPPYGLGDSKTKKNNYSGYDDTKENLIELIAGFLPLAQNLCDVVVLTSGNGNQRLYPEPQWEMAWFTPAGIGRGPWGFCCWQPMLCYGKDPMLAKGKGSYPDAIVHTESASSDQHPCAKPIKFWSWLMERTSHASDTIYEPFSGSGTTIIAAEMTGRICHAIEINPAYVDVAIERWQNFTGQQATLNGKTFDELKAARAKAA